MAKSSARSVRGKNFRAHRQTLKTFNHPTSSSQRRGEVRPCRRLLQIGHGRLFAEIAAHGHVLTPGRYVGAEEVADDSEPFAEKMPRLVAELHAQFAESAKLEKAIKANL